MRLQPEDEAETGAGLRLEPDSSAWAAAVADFFKAKWDATEMDASIQK